MMKPAKWMELNIKLVFKQYRLKKYLWNRKSYLLFRVSYKDKKYKILEMKFPGDYLPQKTEYIHSMSWKFLKNLLKIDILYSSGM